MKIQESRFTSSLPSSRNDTPPTTTDLGWGCSEQYLHIRFCYILFRIGEHFKDFLLNTFKQEILIPDIEWKESFELHEMEYPDFNFKCKIYRPSIQIRHGIVKRSRISVLTKIYITYVKLWRLME